jgi:hypothetical protein
VSQVAVLGRSMALTFSIFGQRTPAAQPSASLDAN